MVFFLESFMKGRVFILYSGHACKVSRSCIITSCLQAFWLNIKKTTQFVRTTLLTTKSWTWVDLEVVSEESIYSRVVSD